ncbi:MAG TPA: MlaD family protein [Nocardioidaceae bacterium]|nr:MlaD family protein [Nocardioidaceae bacterium]
MRRNTRTDLLAGTCGLVAVAAIIWLCLALYTQQFRSFEPLTIKSERAGLLMDAGADVRLHGVVIGRVGKVEADGSGATLTLEIQPDQLEAIPADSSVSIVPPTVFGAKYVELHPGRSAGAIGAGTVIDGANVTVEVNQTFDAAREALTRLNPVKLNAALSASASMVQGRGAQLGKLIIGANRLSRELATEVPDLGVAAALTGSTTRAYQPAVGDLVETLDSSGKVVANLSAHEAEVTAALLSIVGMADTLRSFLAINDPLLRALTSVMLPVAALLSKYAPEYKCVLEGVALNDRLLSAIMGGPDFGGTHRNAHATFMAQRGLPPYKYPENLPKVAAKSGPNCAGLPRVNGLTPYLNFDTGANPYPSKQDSVELGEVPLGLILFGPSGAGAR